MSWKKRAGQQQVAIDLRIIAADQIAGTAERDHVVEQAADVGVMQGLGRGSVAIGFGDLRIGHEGFDQSLEMWILKRGDKAGESLPELADILGGLGQVVGKIDFRIAQLADLVNGESGSGSCIC